MVSPDPWPDPWLERLSNARGVSGDEAEVRGLVRQALAGLTDRVETDPLGNLLAYKPASGRGRRFRLLVAAHMDEVGLLVSHIEKDGTLRFQKVGGLDDRILPSKVVRIGAEGVVGVIGHPPPHLSETGSSQKPVKHTEMTIDIGAADRSEAEKRVKPGDYAAFDTTFETWGAVAKGKAFDDRVGCAVLLELLKRDYPFELVAAFTVQEELGLRGARTAAYRAQPDAVLALEGTVCDQVPRERDESPTTRLGGGPAITIADRSIIADPRLVRHLVRTAEETGIPYQFKQPGIGATDAGRMHLARGGAPGAVVSVPVRYIHAPAGLLSREDYARTVELLEAALPGFPKLGIGP